MPSTGEVREDYCDGQGHDLSRDEAYAQFDKWLAAHDKGVRQEVGVRIMDHCFGQAHAIGEVPDEPWHIYFDTVEGITCRLCDECRALIAAVIADTYTSNIPLAEDGA